ncbi:uncharacterized protein LOC127649465 [Xyrauchen texanus]|uniref:uncharacterized protein LOC127649465 n=1 Tax=Xyrauchen texanus TaxID=154827 RepID=UPI002241DB5A|nr:uncharacterized protein LOC127649465 [Xyrauchen texanus]
MAKCMLRLIILFLLRGTGGMKEADVFCSYGENVTLPCNNAHADCTWIYERNRDSRAVVLFADGIKKNDTERHYRLSLGSKCSLNIYKVTENDYGVYSCQEHVKGQNLDDQIRLNGNYSHVFLHVLYVSKQSTQTEIRAGSVTLSCHLFSYDGYYCEYFVNVKGFQLVWMNQAGVNLQTDPRFQKSSTPKHCNSTLTITLLNEDNNKEWRCLLFNGSEFQTSASFNAKYLVDAVPIRDNTINSEKSLSPEKSEIPTKVWPTLGVSSSRVIIFLGEIAALTAPTVILLLIFCERRAENRRTQNTHKI